MLPTNKNVDGATLLSFHRFRTGINVASLWSTSPMWIGRRGRDPVPKFKMVAAFLIAAGSMYMGLQACLGANIILDRNPFAMFTFLFQFFPGTSAMWLSLMLSVWVRDQIGEGLQKLMLVESHLGNDLPRMRSRAPYHALVQAAYISASIGSHFNFPVKNTTYEIYCMIAFLNYQGMILAFWLEIVANYMDYIGHLYAGATRCLQPDLRSLLRISRILDTLSEGVSSLKLLLGVVTLVYTLTNFVVLNISVLLFIKRPQNSDGGLYFFMWLILQCIPIVTLAFSSDIAKKKAGEYYKQLYRIMKNDKTRLMRDNKLLQGHLAEKLGNFSFTAAGFFDVDLGLLGAMVATILTYSIILLQMGSSF